MTADDLGAYETYVAKLESDLAEARQERDRWSKKWQDDTTMLEEERDEAAAHADRLQRRIVELEAALRENIESIERGDGSQTMLGIARSLRAALQPTTDHEEGLD